MTTADVRDIALQTACPTVIAPRFGSLADMQNGQRVLVASNGIFIQVKLDWLDCIVRMGDIAPKPPLPYGAIQEHIRFSFGVIPVTLLWQFIEAGRAGLPNEVAGGLIYSRSNKTLRLQVYEALQRSADRIHYQMPWLDDDESIAIDLHTHGKSHAFWSATDNRDDQGIKVAGVFGMLHHPEPQALFRLVVNGCYLALRNPWQVMQPDLEAGHGEFILADEVLLDARADAGLMRWFGF